MDPTVGVPDKGVGPCSKSHTGTPPDLSKAVVTPVAKTAPASKGSTEPTAASGSTPASAVSLGKSPLREEERVEPVIVNVEEGGDGGSADKRPPKSNVFSRRMCVKGRVCSSLMVNPTVLTRRCTRTSVRCCPAVWTRKCWGGCLMRH